MFEDLPFTLSFCETRLCLLQIVKKLNSTKQGAFLQHFCISKVITTILRMRTKVASFFIFFQDLSNKTKLKKTMTKDDKNSLKGSCLNFCLWCNCVMSWLRHVHVLRKAWTVYRCSRNILEKTFEFSSIFGTSVVSLITVMQLCGMCKWSLPKMNLFIGFQNFLTPVCVEIVLAKLIDKMPVAAIPNVHMRHRYKASLFDHSQLHRHCYNVTP